MGNTLHVGDHVDLIANGEVVGQGYIYCLDPLATCSFSELGYNRVSLVKEKHWSPIGMRNKTRRWYLH